ncbi:MAG TPA: endonuclease III [Spirochaetaceae bacterium]|jgi:A/G-specific adenine glycosylase|nr:endonuclease III [Spirochaetaceae bacterium]
MVSPRAALALSEADAAEFRQAVLEHYRLEGRSFPWRDTEDPWRVLVSEIMLQQTQTFRVLPKYLAWFERFPDALALAQAPLAEVYGLWKGLGYNSRALRLRDAARLLIDEFDGRVPPEEKKLLSLPGIGSYTARAIRAFAFNLPGAVLETNIRAALIFHFFADSERVSDRELEPVALATMDASEPRRWYYALMDYGSWLKKKESNPSRQSSSYARQSRFEGSARQARGALLKALSTAGRPLSVGELAELSGLEHARLSKAAASLAAEGLVNYEADRLSFAE